MANTKSRSQEEEDVLCVDLDGTLIRTDLLYEGYIKLWSRRPGAALKALFVLCSGIPRFKEFVAQEIELRPELLPYHEEVVRYVTAERERGRKTVLATASHHSLAEAVAEHLGIFDEVHGTSNEENLKGKRKAERLNSLYGNFEYIGDSRADIPVWNAASKVSAVGKSAHNHAKKIDPSAKLFTHGFEWGSIPRMLRVHQWVKNLLVFVPLIMAHRLGDTELFLQCCTAFLLFSMSASAVYLLNDMVDLENDRAHPTKKNRPLASGMVSLRTGILWSLFLVGGAASLSFLLPAAFQGTLALYLGLTTAYSFHLKKLAILDVVTLASLYTVRIIAGGAAVGVPVSEWLLAFSLFMFFSLACVKRVSELLGIQARNLTEIKGRGYEAGDLEQMAMFGSVSGYLSVLVLALYINSPNVKELYAEPKFLWLLCPTLLYWVTRIWLLTRRGEVHEDPIVFALRDKVSYLVLAVSSVLVLLAL